MKPRCLLIAVMALTTGYPQPATAQTETRGFAGIGGGAAYLLHSYEDEDSVAGVGPFIAASVGRRYNGRVVVEAEIVSIGERLAFPGPLAFGESVRARRWNRCVGHCPSRENRPRGLANGRQPA